MYVWVRFQCIHSLIISIDVYGMHQPPEHSPNMNVGMEIKEKKNCREKIADELGNNSIHKREREWEKWK